MAKSKKPESSRLNLFYILQILSSHSDDEHPMSASEIRDKVNEEFGYLSSTGMVISLDTVKRTLEELTERIFPAGLDYNELLYRYGYCVSCLMKKDGQYRTYHAAEGSQAPKKYYYYENSLKTAELLTLKDAIETYSYFGEEDITDIVRKLVKLRPKSFPKSRYFDVAGEARDEDSLLLMNIEETEIENTHRVENFNPVRYRYEYPVMFGEKKETIVLLCRDTGKNYIMNTIVDVFGKNAKVSQASDELVEKYLKHSRKYYEEKGITWLRVSLESTPGGVELWATQYCNDCLVISPEESRERVKKRLYANYAVIDNEFAEDVSY